MLAHLRRVALPVLALGLAIPPAPAATPTESVGGGHVIASATDGSVRTWGSDDHGQLGVGRTLDNPVPATVHGVPHFTDISTSLDTVLALAVDGSVWSWGQNWGGQLGDGTTTTRSAPSRVRGLPVMKAVSAGGDFSLALATDGTVWSWGINWWGQLGTISPDNSLVPVMVEGMANVVAISAGDQHALALMNDGSLWSWGLNSSGQLGDGTTTNRPRPAQIAGLTNVAAVAASQTHSAVARTDGTVWTWGANDSGQLGDGTNASQVLPVQSVGLSGIISVSVGPSGTVALRNDGSVWTWGNNDWGQLGDPSVFHSRSVGAPVPGVSGIVKISMGAGYHVVALDRDGRLHLWGWNVYGQLGDGTVGNPQPPIALAAPVNIATDAGHSTVASGQWDTIVITADGQAWAWGANFSGQLGDAFPFSRPAPSRVSGITDATAVSAGSAHSVALRADGTVLTWGSNDFNAIGGDGPSRSTPGPLAGLSDVKAISAGGDHNLALKNDGTIAVWGNGWSGQLGNGTLNSSGTPIAVPGLANVIAVSAGGAHSVALTSDNRVWTWGSNSNGQLGDGTTNTRSVPALVAGLTNVIAISAGEWHTLALRSDGSVWGWGANGYGQLADGTSQDRLLPGPIAGLTNVVAISAGAIHSLAILRDGTMRAWSWNASGNLGDGTFDFGNRIATVAGLTGASNVSAGGGFYAVSTALKPDGTAWAWGWNSEGDVGDGTFANRSAPVVVIREGGAGSIAGQDWFLDLNRPIAKTIPPEKVPVFLVQASGNVGAQLDAQLQFRQQDVGTSGSVFTFALAPANIVRSAKVGESRFVVGRAKSRDDAKDTPVACVLAQLNSSGQLQAVSASSLQAYVSGVLSAQGQAVNVINGAANAQISGATFYVGYGSSAASMLSGGLNRSVASAPGTDECNPQGPQTGWWWNPVEGGRGYSIEVQGPHIFFAAFHYDVSGRSTWNVASGSTSLDGSLFTGDLLNVSGGQTLGGAYPGLPQVSTNGPITLAFSDAAHGTMIWPGGTVPIERQPFTPTSLGAAPLANQPESGWWWNPAESGRGFFIEWQGEWADIAGYMYDDAGNPVWYIAVYQTPDPRSFSGNWWSYASGQSMFGPYKPPTQTSNTVAPVTITFSAPDTAIMTLPNGRTTALTRQRY